MARLLDQYQGIVRGELPPTPVSRHLGIRFTAAEPGLLTAEIRLDPEIHANMNGSVHGGVIATLADSTLSCAFGTTLEDGEEVATLELKVNYLRPARGTRLSAVGRVVQRGRTV